MVKFTHGPQVSGPSTSIGIMRFFDVDSGGPKMTPEFVIVVVGVFIVLMLALHLTG